LVKFFVYTNQTNQYPVYVDHWIFRRSRPSTSDQTILGNTVSYQVIFSHTSVLFSKKDNCWKLADFGTASQATSKRLNTTRDGRGTAGYRAPETLDSENAKFNQKSDIFALGCILYEIVTSEKLFSDDWASLSYSKTRELPSSVWWPESRPLELDRLKALEILVASMLEVIPSLRPNAREVQTALNLIRIGDCGAPRSNPKSEAPVQVCHRLFSG
jgi:serine/threonine protein kinase